MGFEVGGFEGSMIGTYRVLGESGMGAVYVGEHTLLYIVRR